MTKKRLYLALLMALTVLGSAVIYQRARSAQSISRYNETMTINDNRFDANIARSAADRQHGLSDSPQIAANQAMVFVFPSDGRWGIWMKDMNYPIDILWLDKAKKVQHIVTDAQPDSYPETSFRPPTDVRYVIELKSGTVKDKRITIGTQAAFDAE